MAKVDEMAIVAKALGVNPQTVRLGLQQGVYPFGCAVKCGVGYSYQFFPLAVKRYLGVEIRRNERERNKKLLEDLKGKG